MNISKKNIKIILVFVLLSLTLILILMVKQSKYQYPDEPLKFNHLGVSEDRIDITGVNDIEVKNIPVYYVKQKYHITLIEEMISQLSLSLEKKEVAEGNYVEWSDGANLFVYDSVRDSLTFEIPSGLSVDTQNMFTEFFIQHFGFDYRFETTKQEKNWYGGNSYYAKRLLNGLPLELSYGYEYTDILRLDGNERIISGDIILAEIEQREIYVPTITRNLLLQFINLKEYPKESYINTKIVGEMLSLDYLDEAWDDIGKSVYECKAFESELILLYKNSNQGYLLPVYKIPANCDLKYEGNIYSAPATFYINAVDPQYLSL